MEQRGERALTERQARVLKAIVEDHIRHAGPVASEALVREHALGVSSATVRNEMAELESLGYIYQPHTSAGRIPTDTGYRFFVDSSPADTRLGAEQTQQIRSFFGQPRFEFEESLRQTAALLSRLTDHAAVVFAPVLDHSLVRHVELVRLSTERAMFVLVTDTGRVENHVLAIPSEISDDDLQQASDMLNRLVMDTNVDTAAATITENVEHFAPELREAVSAVAGTIASDLETRENERVFLEGTSNIVDEHKFADLETVRQVIGALEHRRLVLEVMADALSATDLSVRIGAENTIEEMQACAVITAPYGVEGNILGTLGVVGPTRMDYRKTIAAVYEVSSNLGRMLTELGM